MEELHSAYHKGLKGDVKERYDDKIRKCGCDPYVIKKKELSINPCDFPEVTILDIGEYLIHSVSSFTKKKFSAYKSTEAYKHFESGFVLNMGSKKNGEFAIIKGRVKHGQKMNEKPLDVWIFANMNGRIECSHCTCIAGLGETCSHVGAICYAISNLWESSERKSVTDFLCKWNVPSFKDESMTLASKIQWKPPESLPKPPLGSEFVEYCNSLTPFTDDVIVNFINDCKSDGNWCAMGSIIFPEERRKTTLKDEVFLSSLYRQINETKTHRELIDIGKSITIGLCTEEVNEISLLTVSRHKSVCRFGLKRGRITASNFKDCCSANIDDPSISLINRIMNPIDNLNFYPKYVTRKTKKALARYSQNMDLHHEYFQRYECGLIINPELPYFAASPDGLITCDCHGDGCVVIKFLKIMETADSFEVLTREPNPILNRISDDYYINESHELYYQVQLHINVVELKYCDLILWSPKPKMDHLVIRVDADVNFWNANAEKAQKFHEQIMMPEILGKRFTKTARFSKTLPIYQSNNSESDISANKLEPNCETYDVDLANNSSATTQYEKDVDLVDADGQYEDEEDEEKDYSSMVRNLFIEFGEIAEKNLMNESTDEILRTFFDHEDHLKQLYDVLTKQVKRNYRTNDLPFMIEFDIVNARQLQEMAVFAESRLAKNMQLYASNSTDVIFDAILPEWALAAFCKKFNCTRTRALQILETQADINDSD